MNHTLRPSDFAGTPATGLIRPFDLTRGAPSHTAAIAVQAIRMGARMRKWIMAGFILLGATVSGMGVPPSITEVVVSISGGSQQQAGLEAVARAYQQIHPDTVIRIELKGGGHGLGYPTWLTSQLASGSPRPDIVSSNLAPNYDGYVDFDLYRWVNNPYSGRPWNDDFDFDYYQMRNGMGKRCALATQSVKVMWFYNRQLFEKLGLKKPATWDELISLFQQIREQNYTPHTVKFNYRFHQWLAKIFWDQFTRPRVQEIRAQPGDWCYRAEVDEHWTYDPADPFNDAYLTINYARLLGAIRDGLIRYDGPEFKAVLRGLKVIAEAGPADFSVSTGSDMEDSYGRFIRQEALIHLDTSGLVMVLQQDMKRLSAAGRDFGWDVFDTPPLGDPLVQGPARSIESVVGEYVGVIYKNQRQTDAAMDFLMYWLSPRGYQLFVDTLVSHGTFNPGGELLVRGVTVPEQYHAMSRWMKRVGNAETPLNLPFQLPPEGSRLQRDALLALSRYIQGNLSVDEAAAEIQATMMAAVPIVVERFGFKLSDLDHPARDPRR